VAELSDIRESVREHAAAAIIRASKPLAAQCCDPAALAHCCEPAAKDACCGEASADAPSSCGCQP
jgi:hypothetical protein